MVAIAPLVSRVRTRLCAGLAAVTVGAGLLVAGFAAAGPAQAATYVPGFDVSHYQGTVNYTTQYNNGARFVYIKATEGTTYIDPNFSANYTNSYNAGFIRGAYHFAHPNSSSGTTQADYFAAHGGGWSADGKTLPPALDIEYNPSGAECYGLSQASMVSWVKAFSNEIHAKYNKYPMIYTTLDWWTTCTGNSSAFAATNPFWIAKYSSTPPTPPAGTATWTMWQNASSGTFPGDQDQFNGSYSQLQALATNHD
jgi:GH25 family lysozyme M1 (1,4-beta-N-acetylmuramidase)